MKSAALAIGLLALAAPAWGQAPASLTGRWAVTLDQFGTPIQGELQLKQEGSTVTGRLFGQELEGKLTGDTRPYSLES